MKHNAKKYITIDQNIERCDERIRRYELDQFNKVRIWQQEERKKELQRQQNELIEILAIEEKEQIQEYYMVSEMF